MNRALIYIALTALILIGACKSTDYRLPKGNLEKANTKSGDFAPVQQPLFDETGDPCYSEFNRDKPSPVRSADSLIRIMFGDTTGRLNSLVFIDDSSGFVSVSHPPDKGSAIISGVKAIGFTGGTDLFEFEYKDSKFRFTNLGEPINTMTWDSHPSAVRNENGDVLLIWSSDRADLLGTLSSPYQGQERLGIWEDTVKGNTDLYYAFRKAGIWGNIYNMKILSGNINTSSNEQSPHIYCMCYNPVLLFASDRDNGDMDIYSADLTIDFENEKIIQRTEAQPLEKGYEKINTGFTELFPYVAKPYAVSDTVTNYIYFSSDRYGDACENKDKGIYPGMKNVGGFDIYRFPYYKECRPPKIFYQVALRNLLERGLKIPMPFIEIRDFSGNIINRINSDSAFFELEIGRKYKVYGGSDFDEIRCDNTDKVLSNYGRTLIKELEPEIIEKTITVEKDTLINTKTEIRTDSIFTSEKFHISELSGIKAQSGKSIYSISSDNDTVTVRFLTVRNEEVIINGDSAKIKVKVVRHDTIPAFDTLFIKSKTNPIESVLSEKGFFPGFIPKRDTIIYDNIYLEPGYYVFPPCRWEYITHAASIRKNVPYFQTGFWEVNTVENLKKHLEIFNEDGYKDASYIELHPKNQYFGYQRNNLDDEQKEMRRQKRANRIARYKDFAEEVDINLNAITEELGENILPMFTELIKKAPELDNKLIVQVFSYSDIRPVKRGSYLGERDIKYFSGSFDDEEMSVTGKPVDIPTGTSIVSENNETLSQLRAFYGYEEILNRLMEYDIFRDFMDRGEVLLPEKINSIDEFNSQLQKAKIIFLVEGRQIDPEGTFSISGYVGKSGDFSSLDPVRRINLIVNRVQYNGGMLRESPCCSQKGLKLIGDE